MYLEGTPPDAPASILRGGAAVRPCRSLTQISVARRRPRNGGGPLPPRATDNKDGAPNGKEASGSL